MVGWKGLISDPDLNGSYRVNHGIELARRLLLQVNELGVPTATEFLDMVTGQFIADLISWGPSGRAPQKARSTVKWPQRSPARLDLKRHRRQYAHRGGRHPRLPRQPYVPLPGQAGADDDLPDQRQSVWAYYYARRQTAKLSRRGYRRAGEALREFDLPEQLVVDFSHGNCQKQHRRQLEVCADICQQIRAGSTAIAGIMAESFLQEGTQKVVPGQPLTWGQSITDPCLSWEDSERLLSELAAATATRL